MPYLEEVEFKSGFVAVNHVHTAFQNIIQFVYLVVFTWIITISKFVLKCQYVNERPDSWLNLMIILGNKNSP